MRRQWEPGWWRRGGVTSAFLIVGVVLATRSRANVWHCVRVAPVGVRLRTDAVRCMCGRVHHHVCAVFPVGFSRTLVWIHAHVCHLRGTCVQATCRDGVTCMPYVLCLPMRACMRDACMHARIHTHRDRQIDRQTDRQTGHHHHHHHP